MAIKVTLLTHTPNPEQTVAMAAKLCYSPSGIEDDKINGCAALTLAVPVPFVSPDGQAVVPLPAVFIPSAGKLLAL